MSRGPRVPRNHKRNVRYLPPNLHWLPDWKNPEEYSYLENASSKQWAWEFLRRNRDYRNLREAIPDEYPELMKGAKKLKAARQADGSLLIKNSSERLKPLHSTVRVYNAMFGILNFPPDPSERSPKLDFEGVIIIEGPETGKANDINISLSKNKVICIFDLETPITQTNADYIKDKLIEIKKSRNIIEPREQDRSQYILYLRILDAHARQYKNDEIAEVIFPKLDNTAGSNFRARSRIQKNHSTARMLMNKGYKFLGAKGS